MVITIANQKGGVGKTTTAVSLASGLKRKGYDVLFIDTDPQCNASDTYQAKINGTVTLFDLFEEESTIEEAIQKTEYGDIIACDPLLVTADNKYLQPGREYILKDMLDKVKSDYDYVIIDTCPFLGILLTNAITAADYLIIPSIPDRYSLQGLGELNKTVTAIVKHSNRELKVLGLLFVMCEEKTRLSKEIFSSTEEIEKVFNTKTFKSKIRRTIKVKEANTNRKPIFFYAPYCTAAFDYEKLIMEIEGENKNG